MSKQQTYLGDGLYAEWDGYHVRLWADRDNRKHEVFLDQEVMIALLSFYLQLQGEKYRLVRQG